MPDCERTEGNNTSTCPDNACQTLNQMRAIAGQPEICHQVAFEGATGRRIMPQTEQEPSTQSDSQSQ